MNQDTPEFEALLIAKREQKQKRNAKYKTGKAYESGPMKKEFQKVFLFIYGTLMDSKQLKRILGRSPHLQDAKMIGYRVMMCAQYPALIKSTNSPVYGKAFEIETAEELELLKSYETDIYKCTACWIQLRGTESEIFGKTFLWAGPEDLLEEGSFDFTIWQERYSS